MPLITTIMARRGGRQQGGYPVIDLTNGNDVPIETARVIIKRAKMDLTPCAIKIANSETDRGIGVAAGWAYNSADDTRITLFAIYAGVIVTGTLTIDENAGTASIGITM